ncbi:ABC transporter permease [Nocardioides sp. TRM66260-LWL]|uniref:ABC transporter permease n=1 Tax=Nocardioides sp. TRM66260-LWL TaxID=2874478 RepID=UPI001CC68634|nr:ABC transporter permease [Nocardioides sp. TRM66260-LWL]MBZ5732951.1 ABC transporter permease [Nocardioides sp. TRM66260-LWL]
MSTTTSSTPTPGAAVPRTIDVSGTAPVPFGRLVAVELRKSYDTRAGFWLLGTIAGLVVLAEGIATAVGITQDNSPGLDFGAFVGVAAFVTAVLLPVLGIMLVTSEWGQRTAMVTFSLEPRRPRVVAAKYVVGLILTVATALVAVAIGAVCNAFLGLGIGGADWTFGWDYFVGFLIVQSLAMTSGFALATLLLSTPAAIVVFFAYSYVVPTILALASAFLDWFEPISDYIDFQRAQVPLRDLSISGGEQWGQLLVSAAVWLVVPLALGLRRILRAEVK